MLMCIAILKFILALVAALGVLLLLALAVRALCWLADVVIDWFLMKE